MTSVGQKFNRFGRFSLVGLMGAVLQLTLVSLLTRYFGGLSAAATLVAVEITLLHNFLWHERFTWRNQGPKKLSAAGPTTVAVSRRQRPGLVGRQYDPDVLSGRERLKAPVLPTAIGAIVVCSLANFLVADRWVYRAG